MSFEMTKPPVGPRQREAEGKYGEEDRKRMGIRREELTERGSVGM